MAKEIVKIVKNDDDEIIMNVLDNVNVAEVFECVVHAVSEVSELMLFELNDLEVHKRAKKIKEILSVAVDESYLE